MSEKITFSELIDLLSGETNKSREFTHDFLKEFVSVIRSGLEDDGKVNIAGLGKFELRDMSEREGYNPQTEEKITIPAHYKVDFKPYKSFRELLNAPYAHLEAELIEEEQEHEDTKEPAETPPPASGSDSTETDSADETARKSTEEQEATESFEEQEFIPTGPPTTLKNENSKHEAYNESTSAPEEDPDADYKPTSTGPPQYKREEETEDNQLSPYDDQAGTDEDDSIKFHDFASPSGNAGHSSDETNEPDPASISNDSAHSTAIDAESNTNYKVWFAAAGVALLIALLGIWMLTSLNGSSNSQPQDLASTPVQEEAPQQGETSSDAEAGGESQSGSPEPATSASQPNQDQQQNESSAAATPASQNNQPRQPENHQINEGETLWSLADRKFDDPYLWPWIYDANQESVGNPDLIVAGNTLSIPRPDLPQNRLSAVDSLEVAIGYVSTYRWHKNHGRDQAKFYLWGAKTYDREVLEHIKQPIDKDDLAFVNRVR